MSSPAGLVVSIALVSTALVSSPTQPAPAGRGMTISGRVMPEAGTGLRSGVGLRVSATGGEDLPPSSRTISATVGSDWSFRLTGPSGSYSFTASGDREPFVEATRVVVDGAEMSAGAECVLTVGRHDLVVFVAPRKMPPAAVDPALPSSALVDAFQHEPVFWRQFTIAQAIANRRDRSVLGPLVPWLTHEDRHVRGNTAFVFAALGDPRGLETIVAMLGDRSDRPEGQGIPGVAGDGRYHVEAQIRTDRYYAAHLLGDLRDPRAVPILAPLLKDEDVRKIVPWALGQIGDHRAIGPLLGVLDEDDPSMRVLVIYALDTLKATAALPRLTALLHDDRKSNFGAQVTVAEAARAAIAALR